jgi:hypothetical protein
MRISAYTLLALCLVLSTACSGDSEGNAVDSDDSDPSDSFGEADAGDAETEDTAEEDVPAPCIVGISCSDDNPCTHSDTCIDSFCKGVSYSCSDERPCTNDLCDGVGGCQFAVSDGFCLIFNQCLIHGDANASNTCQVCDIDENKIGWSKAKELTGCDDGNPCSYGDYCNKKGQCKKGIKTNCNDDNECTQDSCDPLSGCIHIPISGDCDDGDPCTQDSVCSGGTCHSPLAQCNDNNPCTVDTCLPELGCDHQPKDGDCHDGDACTSGDYCEDSQCISGGIAQCDDGTICTIDKCDPLFGCYQILTADPCCAGAVHKCDDGNTCTTDSCSDDGTGCINSNNASPCDDDNPCTVEDTCDKGECESGVPNSCNDGNPCTADSCNEATGCQHFIIAGNCDDGIECTTDDACFGGECLGDTSACKCVPVFSAAVGKATKLGIGITGNPGQGINVDKKPTCAPKDDCTAGIDNSLAALAFFANENLEKEINKGNVVLLFELRNPKTDGTPFEVAIHSGKHVDKSCKFNLEECDYLIKEELLDDDCNPKILIDNATIINGKLTGGGPGTNVTLLVPLFGSTLTPITLYYGGIEADVVLKNGKVHSLKNAILGGAFEKSLFSDILNQVPPEDLPGPKEAIINLLNIAILNDIDTTGDGIANAVSVGFTFEAIGANIVGVND